MAFYEKGRKTGDFESGVRMALQSILVSPRFLFRLEQATYKAAVEQQRANLAKAKATAVNTALQLQRGKDLVRNQNIPQSTLDQRAAEEGARALPDAARGKIERASGADLSGVRLHQGPAASKVTNAHDARAVAIDRRRLRRPRPRRSRRSGAT